MTYLVLSSRWNRRLVLRRFEEPEQTLVSHWWGNINPQSIRGISRVQPFPRTDFQLHKATFTFVKVQDSLVVKGQV